MNVSCVTPHKPQNDLLNAFREIHPATQVDKLNLKEKITQDQEDSRAIKTILNRLFPSRIGVIRDTPVKSDCHKHNILIVGWGRNPADLSQRVLPTVWK